MPPSRLGRGPGARQTVSSEAELLRAIAELLGSHDP